MRQSSTISEYLDELSRELCFDAALARRVREEVEDHLWETVALEAQSDPIQAQQRATERFGHPCDIAEQFTALSLLRNTRRVGLYIVLVIAVVFIAMEARVASYAAVPLHTSAHMKSLRGIALRVDHWTFLVSVVIGVIGWVYVATRRASLNSWPTYRGHIRCCMVLSLTAIGMLAASVISDGFLTGTRLAASGFSASALTPLLTMVLEITLTTFLIASIRHMVNRIAGLELLSSK